MKEEIRIIIRPRLDEVQQTVLTLLLGTDVRIAA
jgi:hypothetical protein